MSFVKKATRYTDKIAKTMANNICYYSGVDKEGQEVWYFILLDQGKKERFSKDYEENIDLSHYGKILASGYGNSPSAEVIGMMKEKYDFVLVT